MAESAPITDWDMLYRWDWYRRGEWEAEWRLLAREDLLALAFGELARLVEARTLLDAACGFGERVIALADMGLAIGGADTTPEAVDAATQLARAHDAPATFFQAPTGALAEYAPHPVDGILHARLGDEPDWNRLQRILAGLFATLHPGGFLMFPGAPENAGEEYAQGRLDELLRRYGEREAAWVVRDGRRTCSKVIERTRGADYVDERILFVIDEGEGEPPRVETTVRRLPGYWTWSHWRELVHGAGFCHLETRAYPLLGTPETPFSVNVAWKDKAGEEPGGMDASDGPPLD